MNIEIGQQVEFLLDFKAGVVTNIITGNDRDTDWANTFGDVDTYVVYWDDGETSHQPAIHLVAM